MRLSTSVYRTLTVLNTLAIFVAVLGVMGGVVQYRSVLLSKVRAVVERETASSQFLEETKLGPTANLTYEYPQYELRIGPRVLREIQLHVEKMVERRVLTDDLKIWFPARFFYDGEEYRVKIRMRGDLQNHWARAKKSWRVRFPSEKLFQGRRELDLILPNDRFYEIEKVAYDVARDLGLLVPDAGFCRLSINAVDFGTYFWMEKYGPEMLEKLGYPSGEIFRPRNLFTQRRYTGMGGVTEFDYLTSNFENSVRSDSTVGYYMRRWDDFAHLIREADDETFREEISQLLHIEKFLAWNALTWAFGSLHSHGGDNLRWYYDDTSGLMEPILYDVQRSPVRQSDRDSHWIPEWRFEHEEQDRLAQRVIRIPEYRQRRNEILWRLVTDDHFDLGKRCHAYFEQLRPRLITGVEAADPRELDDLHEASLTILADNREDLRDHLKFTRIFAAPMLEVHDRVPRLRVALIPDSRSEIEVESVTLQLNEQLAERVARGGVQATLTTLDGDERRLSSEVLVDTSAVSIQFDGLAIWTPVDDRLRQFGGEWILSLDLPGIDAEEWQAPGTLQGFGGRFRSSVTGEIIAPPFDFIAPQVYRFAPVSVRPTGGEIARIAQATGLPFVMEGSSLTLPPGRYELERDLILPDGYALRLSAGVELRLGPGVSVVCYGPFTVDGTRTEPVRIIPRDPERAWGSIGVVRAGETSRVRHLEVWGGSEARVEGLYLSGQLCFYWSDVEMDHCLVRNARADDGLNVKKAEIAITDCVFVDNAADGFDADWIEGAVTSCVFARNGGDGLDFSGSVANISDCLFSEMGDKAISVGEKSDVTCFNDVIRDSPIGVASKDLSTVTISASVLLGNETGFALYRKKQLFGGGAGRVVGSLLWGNEHNVSLDRESRCEVAACGVDRWEDVDGVQAQGLLRGDPADYYTDTGSGSIVHLSSKIEGSPFKIVAAEEGAGSTGQGGSPLMGRAAGLARPLALSPESFERAKSRNDRTN